MKNKLYGFIVSFFLLGFISCESFFDPFTTSLGKDQVRDLVALYSKLPIGDLINALSNTSFQNDLQAKSSLLTAIGTKSSQDIVNLPLASKEKVLDLAFDVTVSMSTIADIMSSAMNSGEEVDIINMIKDAASPADTKAIQLLLTDKTLFFAGNVTKIGLATTTLLIQVGKSEPNFVIDEFIEFLEDGFEDVYSDEVKKGINDLTISEDSKKSLHIAMGVFESLAKVRGIESFDDIFSGFMPA
ncbi:MAG: hypothetical protein ACRCSG_05365 [Cellulosilyticaceae bacterium]